MAILSTQSIDPTSKLLLLSQFHFQFEIKLMTLAFLNSKNHPRLPSLISSRKARNWKSILVENVVRQFALERKEERTCTSDYLDIPLWLRQEANQLMSLLRLCIQKKWMKHIRNCLSWIRREWETQRTRGELYSNLELGFYGAMYTNNKWKPFFWPFLFD